MNISRKEFFRKSLLSLGEAVYSVTDALKTTSPPPMEVPDMAVFNPSVREDLVAVAGNERCLARSCGCLSCVDRCEPEAIRLIPGVGVRINPRLCNGCGTCEYVCPTTPKAIHMEPRKAEQRPSAVQAELPPHT